MADEVHARFARHIDVAQHESKGLLGQLLTGLARVRGQTDGIAVRFEQIAQQPPDGFLIVDDQDVSIFNQALI